MFRQGQLAMHGLAILLGRNEAGISNRGKFFLHHAVYICVYDIVAPFTDLDPDHHVEVSLRVLLDDVADVVGLARLLELAPRHKVLDLPDRPDRVLVRLSQTAK